MLTSSSMALNFNGYKKESFVEDFNPMWVTVEFVSNWGHLGPFSSLACSMFVYFDVLIIFCLIMADLLDYVIVRSLYWVCLFLSFDIWFLILCLYNAVVIFFSLLVCFCPFVFSYRITWTTNFVDNAGLNVIWFSLNWFRNLGYLRS